MEKYLSHIAACKRIAIMGGTFDPVHNGHLVAAEAVRKEFDIEKVLFMPSGKPPHKLESDISPNEHRYAMTVLATASNPNFYPSRLEIDRAGQTYTADTIKELLLNCQNEVEIFFITGADAITQILTWKDSEYLLSMCNFVAVTRPGYNKEDVLKHINKMKEKYKSKLYFIEIPALAISSTDIRSRVFVDKSIKYLLPYEVEQYIMKFELYKSDNVDDSEFTKIKKYLKNALDDERYVHSMGVAMEAVKLAKTYGYDKEKAYLAGVLHDCAKNIPNEKKKKIAKEYGIKLDPIMEKRPDLLHGFIGAEIAKSKFDINDIEILDAIKYHTTARKNMGLLEKILFVADVIEPSRETNDQLANIKISAYKDLDMALKQCLSYKMGYLNENKKDIHPLAFEALNYYGNE